MPAASSVSLVPRLRARVRGSRQSARSPAGLPTSPAATGSFAVLAFSSVAPSEIHIAELVYGFHLTAYRALAEVAIGEAIGLLLHRLD
jgi:hypothetical protein